MRLPGIAALLIASFAACAFAQPREIDRVLAVVNDEVITSFELRERVRVAEEQLRRQGTPLPGRNELDRQVLERLINDRVQLQFARETGIRVDDGQVDSAIGRIAANNRMSVADFRKALEGDGVSWQQFREEIRAEITLVRLREREVDDRVVVSEGEIDNFLSNPSQQAGQGDEVLASHILIRVPEGANPEQLKTLRSRAETALSQVRSGADFGQVAAAYSDAADALSGGQLGWRSPDRLPALFANLLSAMRVGQVSEVTRSPAGFHIIKLLDRRGAKAMDEKIPQTHARHILIRTNELVSEAEARRKLTDLKQRLDHGADFAELARLYSNDLSASKGGDLGWVYPGDTVPEFERAMDSLQPGQISEPVMSPFGWHLIQVIERRVEGASAERRRLAARQALKERKSIEAYQEWLRQLRDRAYVEYRVDER